MSAGYTATRAVLFGLVGLAGCVAALAAGPGLARADVFGPISLASVSAVPGFAGNQQADYAHDPAISGDGHYVAFDGSFGGRTGVWRRDLQSGAVSPVAVEDLGEPALSAPDASLPSISQDGRYVSFTTTAPLDPADVNTSPDVYVRDMTRAPGEAGSYELASAADGASAGLTYEPKGATAEERENEAISYGSVAAGRTALSADGRKVAFVTTAISNLVGSGTPALQVVVRDLDTRQTELVSVADDPATGLPLPGHPVSGEEALTTYGAVFTGIGPAPFFHATPPYEPESVVGASISGDGTTVAWMGVNIGQQAKLLAGEAPRDSYTEPLWRRVADGPTAPVRRITGGSDPENPACAASGETRLPEPASASDPCQGPFRATQEGGEGVWHGGSGVPVPRLSGDGRTVAFIANAPLVSRGAGVTEPKSDAYLVNMGGGLTRVAALRPLTELAGGDQQNLAENGPIVDIGISPDATQVAFATKRTEFPLGSPAYVSTPASVAGMLELYDVDLSNDTLTRVSEGFSGGPSEHPHMPVGAGQDPYTQVGDGALSPSLSDDGVSLAFSSTASNLVFGDGNTPNAGTLDGGDAFVVSRVIFGSLPTPQSISPAPAPPASSTPWRLGATARSRADGSVVLYVSLPGAGTLQAAARSGVRIRVRRHGRTGTTVATRNVASSKKLALEARPVLVTLTLTLARSYRPLARKRHGQAASATLTFTAPHRPTQRLVVPITFRRSPKAKAKKSQAHRARRPAAVGGRPRT